MTDPSEAAVLSLTSLVFSEHSYENVLQHIVDSAREFIVGCSMAGMTLLERSGPTTAVATSVEASRVDAIQYATNGGPCLEAYRRREVVRIKSTKDEPRWREFCDGALKEGVRSTLSFPLVVNGDGLGALNLYSNEESGFDDTDEQTAAVFAANASTTLANARSYWKNEDLRRNLEEALETRGVIEQAKGVLIAREGYTPDEAFGALKRASQRANRKVNEMAREIVENARRKD